MSNLNEKKKFHFIYKTSNIETGKYYVGMHSTCKLNDGYLGSGKRLRYSINKHGNENFVLKILEFLPTRELLVERERKIVNVEMIDDPNCLNLQTGGISGFDYINNLRMIDSEYDKKWRKLQSERMKDHHKNGKIKYDTFTDKKHSEETKRLMSVKASKHTGDKNSQYGTCWMTKGGINKKIKNSDLLTFANEGWHKGRVI